MDQYNDKYIFYEPEKEIIIAPEKDDYHCKEYQNRKDLRGLIIALVILGR
jgi:hypothetical protein